MRLQSQYNIKRLFPTPHSPLPAYANKYGYATQATEIKRDYYSNYAKIQL
ncbi:hypothetical protein NSP_21390 [Nodularia spumigena CCY9414]|nr:hypothetical protein NSP_21390 [Nodularia spumigena CCY9414]